MRQKEARLVRVGVLGAGPISQAAHFEACRKARNAQLYAICDVAEDLVNRMAAIHQPHITYLDYDAMLADPQVEAVIIATADQFHVKHAAGALAAANMSSSKNRLASPSRSAKPYACKCRGLDCCFKWER